MRHSVCVWLCLLTLWCGVGCRPKVDVEALANSVKIGMNNKMQENESTRAIKVESVSLHHEHGQTYSGVVTMSCDGKSEQVQIEVKSNGERFRWVLKK